LQHCVAASGEPQHLYRVSDMQVMDWAGRALTLAAFCRPRSVEREDGACDFACLHRAEGLVDVVEAATVADHLVEK
jgi:hypothetical protein